MRGTEAPVLGWRVPESVWTPALPLPRIEPRFSDHPTRDIIIVVIEWILDAHIWTSVQVPTILLRATCCACMWQNTGPRSVYIGAITEDVKVHVPALQISSFVFWDVAESVSNRDSSAYTRWTAEESRFNFERGARIFPFHTVPRSALGLFKPRTKCVSAVSLSRNKVAWT